MKGDVMQYFNNFAKQNHILINQVVKPAGTAKIMSSADDISLWYEAVQYYEAGQIDEAIQKFKNVNKNAKMLTNIGCCYLRKNDLKSASEIYEQVVSSDRYLALGFFLLALTEYFQDKYESALKNFEKTFELLRGNKFVDYRQLGFKYQLYSCEVLTNLAAVNIKLGKIEKAKEYLVKAFENKSEKRHERIFAAIEGLQNGAPIQLFLPPKSEIFRPSKAAVANIKKKDFLGTAKVISTDSEEDCYACFSGIKDKVIEQKKAEAEIKNKPKPVDKPRIIGVASPVQYTPSSTTAPAPAKSTTLPSTPPTKSRPLSMAPKGQLPSLDSIDGDRKRSTSVGVRPNKPLPQLSQPTKALPVLEVAVEKNKEPECQSAPEPVIINDENEGIEIEVEYRFIKKVRLPAGFTLSDLQQATVQQCVPKQVEFRLTDQLGRQTPVTNDTIPNMLNTSVGKHHIQCFSVEP